MRVLSLETATYIGGVAFVGPDGARESLGPFPSRGASRQILAAADDLLRRHNCAFEGLDLVAVSTGPGLFTGVRVGLSIAKTLAWAQGALSRTALIEVPTLQAVAALSFDSEQAIAPGDLVAAVTDARRGEVYAALFRAGDDQALEPLGEDIVVRPDQTEKHLRAVAASHGLDQEPILLIGDGAWRYEETLLETFGPKARILARREEGLPLCVADIGLRLAASGRAARPEEVRPHYVRRPDARRPVLQSFLAPETDSPM